MTAYLNDLVERLMYIPIVHGVDQGDIDTLRSIVTKLTQAKERLDWIAREIFKLPAKDVADEQFNFWYKLINGESNERVN